MTHTLLGRREFLKTGGIAGAGLLIGFRLSPAEARELLTERAANEFAPNAWIHVGADNVVTLFADHVELGQGAHTALPMILADEMGADWTQVRVTRMPDDPSAWPRRIMTVGSQSVRTSWQPLRHAGATAREMLVAAAAKTWNVDAGSCRVEKGVVSSAGHRATFGELAATAATMPVPSSPTLKDPSTYTIVGTRIPRVDIPSKVDGSAQFGMDARVPNMLYASVMRPPTFGSSVKSFDATAAKQVPGVRDVVPFKNGVAVLANDTFTAFKGRKALKVEWTEATHPTLSSADIRKQFIELAGQPATVAKNVGDVDAALKGASNTITVDYELPFLSHSPMEPMNCLAHVRPDGADVWVSTQAPTSFQQVAAQLAGLKPDQVKLHVTMVGGGFGRRSKPDVLEDAVLLSKQLNAPVKVVWMREDDMQHDAYRPYGIHRLSGAIGPDGWPVAWMHRIVTQNALGSGDSVGGAADLPYAIPNLRVELNAPTTDVPVMPWRSVGHSQNGFVTESFLDELAAAGKKDPVEFRRRLLASSPRHLGVMELAVSKSDWGKPMPKGSGRGIAVHAMTGSYVAQIAEVTVADNTIHVNRVIAAADCGVVINPDTLASQVEGAIVMGLTAALKNEITIANAQVEQSNFNTYPMLRMSEAPQVEVYTVKSSEAPGGMGEPGVPPIAPAVANAVFAATGQRLRKMPFRLA